MKQIEYDTKIEYAEETGLIKITHFEDMTIIPKTDYEIVKMLCAKFRNQHKVCIATYSDESALYITDNQKLENRIRELGAEYSLSEFDISRLIEQLTKEFRYPIETEEFLSAKENKSIYNSTRRTINKVYNLACSNTWEYFLTLTFDDRKLLSAYGQDATDYETVVKALTNWLDRMRKANPNLKYLIVPEQHKKTEPNGLKRWHFHCLVSNMGTHNFVIATDTQGNELKMKGRTTYRIKTYDWGFSTAIVVDDTRGISGYITKYITKNLCLSTKGKKRYWNSRNLNVMSEDKQFWDRGKYSDFKTALETCEHTAGKETYRKELDEKLGDKEFTMHIHIINEDIFKLLDEELEDDFSKLSILFDDIVEKKKKAS